MSVQRRLDTTTAAGIDNAQFAGSGGLFGSVRKTLVKLHDPKTYLALALRDGGKYYGEQKNDITNAFKCFEESWALNPKDPETARLMGVAFGVTQKPLQAIEWFTKAVEVAPKEAGFLWDLGLAYSASGDLAKGEEWRKKAAQRF